MAHTLSGYDGACSEIHGHSYRLFVTVAGIPNGDPGSSDYGMVMDFRALKRLVCDRVVDVYDHALLIRQTPPDAELITALRARFEKTVVVEWQPTCENLVLWFAEVIAAGLPEGVRLHSLKLHETAVSYAEWFASDNE